MSEKRHCKYCDHVIAGRSDKVFCNTSCRNGYHNQNQAGYNKQVRPVFMALKRNRRILLEALDKNKSEPIKLNELALMGYNWQYCTEHRQLNNEDYYFCFDIGYKVNEKFQVSIVTREQFDFLSKPLPDTTWQLVNRNNPEDKNRHLGKNR